MPKPQRWAVAVCLAVATLLTGCAIPDVDLVEDRRVHIDAPQDQQTVDLPVTLRWSAHDVDPGLTYAVFVDHAPIRPGATLRSLAEDAEDVACLSRPDCPDAAWLQGRGIYLTRSTSLVLDTLADRRPLHRSNARDSHEAVIVLLAGTRRVGEGSWYRQFYVRRETR